MEIVTKSTLEEIYVGNFQIGIDGDPITSKVPMIYVNSGAAILAKKEIPLGIPIDKARQIGYNLLRKYLTSISNECWVSERQLDKELV